jgi:mannosyltransferase OCH1-like enzyme
MIPKTIHYCWFGKQPHNDVITLCLKSWKEQLPDFEIKEWNEDSFPVLDHPFTRRTQKEKQWAFTSDYARLKVLYDHGGFYLDTDMLILQSLSPLCNNECVLGEEEKGIISAGMIGASKHDPFIQRCMAYYDNISEFETIPRILTKVYATYEHKNSLTVLPPKAFYPFDVQHIKDYRGQDLGKDVYGVHMWNYSWGTPLNKAFKKLGIYAFGKKIAEFLGIKKILKKILGFV